MKPHLGPHIWVPLLDLLLFKRGRRFGVEMKVMDVPTLTGSMLDARCALRSRICSLNT
jgi:hypothetical protein